MSGEHVEYAVRVSRPDRSGTFVEPHTVSQDEAVVRRRLPQVREDERLYAVAAGQPCAEVKLVMRTVTDWCEVKEKEGERDGER